MIISIWKWFYSIVSRTCYVSAITSRSSAVVEIFAVVADDILAVSLQRRQNLGNKRKKEAEVTKYK
jgi:hypothetical protein